MGFGAKIIFMFERLAREFYRGKTNYDSSADAHGLAFDPSFESCGLVGTTDRRDNNTFRFVLGNDTALKAAQAGNMSPCLTVRDSQRLPEAVHAGEHE